VSNGKGPAPYDPNTAYTPKATGADLKTRIDNPLLPFLQGATWKWKTNTPEGDEYIELSVLPETKTVWGVQATVVYDVVFLDKDRDGKYDRELDKIEETWDWYGQHKTTGDVWYLGEDTDEWEDGKIVCAKCGAWTAGVDGALPGVVMLGAPQVGAVYRQEYKKGEAEDLGEVVTTQEAVTLKASAALSWTGCVTIRERSVADLSVDETKYFCPGVGGVRTNAHGNVEELIEFKPGN